MLERLRDIADRHAEVERLLSLPETVSDPSAMQRLGREYSDLQSVVDLWKEYDSASRALEQARSIAEDPSDPEMQELAASEATEL